MDFMLDTLNIFEDLTKKRTGIRKVINSAAGQECRRRRLVKGLSLRELASKSNFSWVYISDLERGNRNWSPDLWEEITKHL